MSTIMDGIDHQSLFADAEIKMGITVSRENRYRVLAKVLPWKEIGDTANRYRAKKVLIHTGRPLNLRAHLGALIAQSMSNWTDRETEDMVAHHVGVRFLCDLQFSIETIDHTSIETFRNQLGKDGVEAINKIVVGTASQAGFTGSGLCSSDTTVQESPIAYPTEVGHMKNIADKLVGIGKRMRKKLKRKLTEMEEAVHYTVTKIRLFTRGKKEKAIEQKKKLSKELQATVSRLRRMIEKKVSGLNVSARTRYEGALSYYKTMLSQIRHWMRKGFHRPGKYLSLWEKDARAITRNKSGKDTEFGRRWFITMLTNGYIIGAPCLKLGSDSDTRLAPEILGHFEKMMDASPKKFVYDRGGDGSKNHKTLKEKGIVNGIFRKGKESLIGLGRNTVLKTRRERALSEASIATIKSPRYGFTKPRVRSSEGCVLKGHFAILGANLTRLTRDWVEAKAAA